MVPGSGARPAKLHGDQRGDEFGAAITAIVPSWGMANWCRGKRRAAVRLASARSTHVIGPPPPAWFSMMMLPTRCFAVSRPAVPRCPPRRCRPRYNKANRLLWIIAAATTGGGARPTASPPWWIAVIPGSDWLPATCAAALPACRLTDRLAAHRPFTLRSATHRCRDSRREFRSRPASPPPYPCSACQSQIRSHK